MGGKRGAVQNRRGSMRTLIRSRRLSTADALEMLPRIRIINFILLDQDDIKCTNLAEEGTTFRTQLFTDQAKCL